MPTYEYLCSNCETEFELFQSMKSEPIANCPKCKKPAIRKISVPAGIVFKGSGFYITDYKNNGSKTATSTSTIPTKESKNTEKSDSTPKTTEVKTDKKIT